MSNPLTAGEKIARDLCEMDAPIDNIIEVDPVDVARRIDEVVSELRQRLAEFAAMSATEACITIPSVAEYIVQMEEQLTAAQAREQQYREALLNTLNHDCISDLPCVADGSPLLAMCVEALAQSDTSALEAIVQKVGEVMRERCIRAAQNPMWRTDDDIRALPPMTLDDLPK